MAGIEFRNFGDDIWFPNVASTYDSLCDWIKHRYFSWSGRVVADGLLPFFLSINVWVWRITNATFFLLLIAASYRFSSVYLNKPFNGVKAWAYCFFLIITIFVTNRYVLEEGMFWATGSINYLWPVACLVVAIIPFARIVSGVYEIRYSEFFSAAIAATFASYQEQTGLILVCFSLFTQLWVYCRNKKIVGFCVTLSLLSIVNVAVLLLAPGNVVRYYKEIEKFYPIFGTLSVWDKLYNGLNYLVLNHWYYDSYKPLLIVLFLSLLVSWKYASSKLIKFAILIPLLYLAICIFISRIIDNDYGYYLNLDIYEIQGQLLSGYHETRHNLFLWPVILGTCSLSILPVSWIISLDSERSFTLTLLYGAALLSGFVVCLSPTVFASSYRIFFIPNMLMLFVGLLLFSFLLEDIKKPSISLISFFIIIALMGTSAIYGYCS
jgi:hypothetical protein